MCKIIIKNIFDSTLRNHTTNQRIRARNFRYIHFATRRTNIIARSHFSIDDTHAARATQIFPIAKTRIGRLDYIFKLEL